MTSNVWDEILDRAETKINRHSFYTWFKPTAFVREADNEITVKVPSGLFRDWLTTHYAGVIGEAVTEINRDGVQITYVAEGEVTSMDPLPVTPTPLVATVNLPAARPAGLNPRYVFETFVFGESYQFAHVASLVVAEAP